MADTVKSSNQLKLVAAFSDGDDRTIAVDDPKTGLTKDDINDELFISAAKNVLVGDKAGAPFVGWKSAKVVEQTTVNLDLKN